MAKPTDKLVQQPHLSENQRVICNRPATAITPEMANIPATSQL
ncbi:hypothetical protein HMPREF0591_1711 [Mycobacterium parascrofulaceum ATCC BAA-614]|uniref:Uncharacterized protein n=1 Tax=Mycobacterium parascrofulaceum ATCC BAA-614 TaxID=525368 RepID=D5P6B7_9MYCO|nr:hypothetical protein HMPREF0591_1711 [Mycobacterium parascrofulaceum ATCC BAA-614]